MHARPSIPHRHLWSVESLSPADIRDVLDTARRLRLAAREGQAGAPLRGRNIALLNDAAPDDGADGLRSAALGLGAQVSHLRPSDSRLLTDNPDPATVRLLGRLYDAIDCEAMPPALVADVAREAGVPVFNGLGGSCHPTRVLAELQIGRAHV